MLVAQNLTQAEAEAIAKGAKRNFPQKRFYATKLSDEPDGYGVRLWSGRSNKEIRTYLLGAVDAVNAMRRIKVSAEHEAILAKLDWLERMIKGQV